LDYKKDDIPDMGHWNVFLPAKAVSTWRTVRDRISCLPVNIVLT